MRKGAAARCNNAFQGGMISTTSTGREENRLGCWANTGATDLLRDGLRVSGAAQTSEHKLNFHDLGQVGLELTVRKRCGDFWKAGAFPGKPYNFKVPRHTLQTTKSRDTRQPKCTKAPNHQGPTAENLSMPV